MSGREGRTESIAKSDQRAANLWLKQHDDRDRNEQQPAAKRKSECGWALVGGQPIEHCEYRYASCYEGGARDAKKL